MRMSKRVNPNDRNTSNQPESKHSNNERTYFFSTLSLSLFLHSPPLYSLQTPPLFLTQCKNPNKTPLRYSRSRDLSYVRVTGRCLPLLTRLLRKVSEGCVSHISGVSGCVVGVRIGSVSLFIRLCSMRNYVRINRIFPTSFGVVK